MTVAAEHEAPRTAPERAFRDALTFAFGDPRARLYGLLRLTIGDGAASALALVYADGEVVEATTASTAIAGEVASWGAVAAGGLRTAVDEPLSAWTVALDGDAVALDLRFAAASPPAALDAGAPVARAGGMEGYEQLCSVTGEVGVGARSRRVDCLGQRGHLWGAPDWKRVSLARTLSAWIGPDRAVALTTVRPAKARHHDEELAAGVLFDGGEPRAIADPRLSTTYDREHRQRRAGLELWLDEDDPFARRAAGEAVCGTTIELGELRLDSAFFAWHMEGREGAGRYDVLRRADAGGRSRRR